jgi:hypothetical protein
MRDQQHLLVEIHVGDLQVHKLGDARTGLEQRFDELRLSRFKLTRLLTL